MSRAFWITVVVLILVGCGGMTSEDIAVAVQETITAMPVPTVVEQASEVTVEVPVTVEVTRVVEVEVTRQVEVTQVVERVVTATPLPEPTATPTPDIDVVAYTFITGTHALESLPQGALSEVEIVQIGQVSDFGVLPVLVRNNSATTVARIDISATVLDSDGQLVGTGDMGNWSPNVVPPQGYMLATVRFGSESQISAEATFEFNVTARDVADNTFENIRDLPVIEFNSVNDTIVGRLDNIHNEEIDLMSVSVMCFDLAGDIVGFEQSFVDQDVAEPGAEVPFQADIPRTVGSCETYLLTARGFGDL